VRAQVNPDEREREREREREKERERRQPVYVQAYPETEISRVLVIPLGNYVPN
jgi:hypothetical protein